MIRLLIYYIIFALNLVLLKGLTFADEEKCVFNDARKAKCGINEICVISVCHCVPGYTRLNNSCVKNVPNSNIVPVPAKYAPIYEPPDEHNSSVAAAVIIPIMLILIVIGSVVLVRKYNVVTWVRNKINQRQTPYDEVMIGQDDDDPPLAGV